MRFSGCAESRMDCQKTLSRTWVCEKVEETFFFAVYEGKMEAHCLIKSAASKTPANRKMCAKTERLHGSTQEKMAKESTGTKAVVLGVHGVLVRLLALLAVAACRPVTVKAVRTCISCQLDRETLARY